jgi:pentatricopeptide repeat protein
MKKRTARQLWLETCRKGLVLEARTAYDMMVTEGPVPSDVHGRMLSVIVQASESKSPNDQDLLVDTAEHVFATCLRISPDPKENIFSNMVRILATFGQNARALSVLEDMRCKHNITPKLRTFTPLLDMFASQGDVESCKRTFAEIKAANLQPTEIDFANLILGMVTSGAAEGWQEVLLDLSQRFPVLSHDPLVANIRNLFQKLGWAADDCMITNAEGHCAVTGKCLRPLQVPTTELQILMDLITRLVTEVSIKRQKLSLVTGLNSLKQWLSGLTGFYDVILDGANIGHFNQNWEEGEFSHRQIDEVVRLWESRGKRVLVVLHQRWLQADTELAVVKRKRKRLPQIGSVSAEEVQKQLQDAEYDNDDENDNEDLTQETSTVGEGKSDENLNLPAASPTAIESGSTATTEPATGVITAEVTEATTGKRKEVERADKRNEIDDIVASWKAKDALYVVPAGSNDDW